MARAEIILVFMLGLCTGGCASQPTVLSTPVDTSRTTVVLMPDEGGNVGAVWVRTQHGSQEVDKAYAFTTVEGTHSRPSEIQLMGEEWVNTTFRDILEAQPPKPKSFVLYFVLDKTGLTEESKALLPAVFEAVRERKPTEITIFGHADATGSEKRNVILSANRARAVAEILRKHDPSLGRIDVQFFGDKEPLVPSSPQVPEPRNRRAEIMIL
jgi:peptidoglycan-associated lipoprotein